MRDYRLYLMDPTGHITSALPFDCEDDEEALSRAERERRGLPAELWQRERFVQTFKRSEGP